MSRQAVRTLSLAVLLSLGSVSVSAQQQQAADGEMTAAEAALAACAAAAAEKRTDAALSRATDAERSFRTRLARRPNDVRALVGLARTIGQCRIPFAELMQMGELSAESVELLKRALEVEPTHWIARYVLAMNYYRAPAFLGRAPDAARELDRLIEQQGERNDVAEFARTFEYRGLLWSRAGNRDSAVAVWNRGLRLFPTDSALQARLGPSVAAPEMPASSEPERSSEAPAATSHSTIDTVRVTASRSTASHRVTTSERVVTRSEMVRAAGGMADVLLAVQLQPGATRVGESADLFARGGDPSETPTFIDGGRILSVARFEGLNGGMFGALDPFVIRSARFSTGGFSARHGNALSGLLQVETDGRPRESQWRTGIGLSQLGATTRRPLGDRSGVWGTVRGTHAGALLRTHGRSEEFVGSPYSIETMAGYVVEPKPGDEWKVVGLLVKDGSARVVDANGYSGAFDAEGATRAMVVSSKHLLSRVPVLARTNVTLSDRSTSWAFGVLSRERTESSAAARGELEYAPTDALSIRGGVEGARLSRAEEGMVPATPAVAPGSPVRDLGDVKFATWSVGGFAEGEWRVGRVKLLTGLRADRLPGESEVTIDPRLSASTTVDAWTARVSAGEFHQGRWRAEAAIPDAGTPSGLPRRARHLVAGVQRDGALSVKAEAFVKDYGGYAPFGAGPPVVDGMAQGVDVTLQRGAGERLTGWVGYSYLDATLDLDDGRTVRSPFDVTHTATGSASLRIARGTSLGSSLRYGTGRPHTPIVSSAHAADGSVIPVYGTPGSERLPSYVRWDARLMQYMPLGRSMIVGYVEMLNILDRANVAGYVWDAEYRSRKATNTFYAQRTMLVGLEIQSR